MVSKPKKPTATDAPAPAPESDIASHHATASNIWLAGLGAMASAQAEGSKAFEALVKQGMEMQDKTQALAKARMAEAAQRVEAMTSQAAGATPWGRLGGIFEDRVAQALKGLGMPTAQELTALTARVEALEQALRQQPAAAKSSPRKSSTRTPTKN